MAEDDEEDRRALLRAPDRCRRLLWPRRARRNRHAPGAGQAGRGAEGHPPAASLHNLQLQVAIHDQVGIFAHFRQARAREDEGILREDGSEGHRDARAEQLGEQEASAPAAPRGRHQQRWPPEQTGALDAEGAVEKAQLAGDQPGGEPHQSDRDASQERDLY